MLTPDGRLVQWLYGLSPDPVELGNAISAAEAGRIGSFAEAIILLCYHYDPKTGRYTLLVDRVIRIVGSAFALSLAGAVLFTLQRERRARGTRWRARTRRNGHGLCVDCATRARLQLQQ